jgi:hypothetical protein
MPQQNDKGREVCEHLYEKHRLSAHVSILDLMHMAWRAANASAFADGLVAGAQQTTNLMDLVLNGGVLRPTEPPLTVRGVEWDEPTDDEREASEQRGARSYASLVDDQVKVDQRHYAKASRR